MLNKLKKINPKIILIIGIIFYIIATFIFGWIKYKNFGYNALDLAIYNNILFNAASGNGFWSSIQGHHYFADHFEPYLYLLLPIYKLWSSPLFLLFIQSVWLALTAVPIYLIAKKILNQNWGIIFSLSWLLNPLAWNVNMTEWHILPLAIPLLLFAYYFYLKNKFKYFIIFLILALLVREDVAIVVFMFSALAFLEKKPRLYIATPALLAIFYFVLAGYIGSMFNNGEISKFAIYYEWLLSANIMQIISHILSIANIEMILGLSISFLFLPLLSPRYLILLLGPLAQFILGEPGGSNVIVETHYSSLFMPALIIGSIWGIEKIRTKQTKLAKIVFFDIGITKFIGTCSVLIVFIAFSPAGAVALPYIQSKETPKSDIRISEQLKMIPPEASVMSGYSTLANLSSRELIYPWHYIITGKQQFSDLSYPYKLADYLIFDTRDFITYELQFTGSKIYSKYYPKGMNNIKQIIDIGYEQIFFDNQYLIFKKNNQATAWETVTESGLEKNKKTYGLSLFLLQAEKKENQLELAWQTSGPTEKNYFVQIEIHKSKFIRPLTFFTPTNLWQGDKAYTSSLYIPDNAKEINIQLIEISGQVQIGPDRGTKSNFEIVEIGEKINISI